jgi:hypothetical protein
MATFYMLYIKSVLVGIATALITIVISMIAWMVISANQLHRQFPQLHRQFPQAEISFDLRSALARPSIVWLIGALAFIGGFYWRLRRRSQ